MRHTGQFGSVRHLAGRFFGALWPGGPSQRDEEWVGRWLLPGEHVLWKRMSGPDRRHAVGVARGTIELLSEGPGQSRPDRAVVASALLHDVGKIESGLGTISRALVTGVGLFVGRSRLLGQDGAELAAWRRRVRDYLTHDRIGADLLRRAGSDPLTVSWAEDHHLEPSRWRVERRVADALKAADGD